MPHTPRIASLAELDALVGEFVLAEKPEIYWEDSHGTFQFDTEEEARQAIHDPYYQNFLPDVDWSGTIVRQVRSYGPYIADPVAFWRMVAAASQQSGVLTLSRDRGEWSAAFGNTAVTRARSAQIAVGLATLAAKGMHPEVDHSRLERQLGLILGKPESQQAEQ